MRSNITYTAYHCCLMSKPVYNILFLITCRFSCFSIFCLVIFLIISFFYWLLNAKIRNINSEKNAFERNNFSYILRWIIEVKFSLENAHFMTMKVDLWTWCLSSLGCEKQTYFMYKFGDYTPNRTNLLPNFKTVTYLSDNEKPRGKLKLETSYTWSYR